MKNFVHFSKLSFVLSHRDKRKRLKALQFMLYTYEAGRTGKSPQWVRWKTATQNPNNLHLDRYDN